MFVGAMKHLGEGDSNELRVEVVSTEALTTSQIEGEILDRQHPVIHPEAIGIGRRQPGGCARGTLSLGDDGGPLQYFLRAAFRP